MENLFILGSSYLLPNNKEWHSNLKYKNIKFGEFGDWAGLISTRSSDDDALLVFFLDDILSERDFSQDIMENNLGPLLKVLERTLQASDKPVIAGVSPGENFDAVRYSKGGYYLKRAQEWVLSHFEEIAEKYEHFYVLDLREVFGEIRTSSAFDNRNWSFARCRLSASGIGAIAQCADKIFERHYSPASKVLVLDCDNTIWGGVVGEDGIDGIRLGEDGIGQAFVDFQKEAKALLADGVVIVLASKNNEDDVWEVFEKHEQMVLNKADLVAWRINWEDKANNLNDIASELDLGVDSFVFWDDNPVERDKMKQTSPSVITVDVPNDVYEWPNVLRRLFAFAKSRVSKEDTNKTEQYHNRARFIEARDSVNNEIDYLKSIKLAPKKHEINQSNIQRAAQLCSKTNQFNFRTVRHSEADLMGISNQSRNICFLVSLKDIYGDHGIVGLVCIEEIDKETAFLNTLLMSCRILGRHLESWMIKQALDHSFTNGFSKLIAGFIPSDKNSVAASVLPTHGFTRMDSDIPPELLDDENQIFYVIPTTFKNLPFQEIYE